MSSSVGRPACASAGSLCVTDGRTALTGLTNSARTRSPVRHKRSGVDKQGAACRAQGGVTARLTVRAGRMNSTATRPETPKVSVGYGTRESELRRALREWARKERRNLRSEHVIQVRFWFPWRRL
jgi:hypothetical protein